MAKRKLNPKIIREFDRVRVVNPVFILRVGYPKCVSDYEREAKDKFGNHITEMLKPFHRAFNPEDRFYRRFIHDMSYLLAKKDQFGGRVRSLHTIEVPEAKGQEFWAHEVKTVKTGTYYPPSGPSSYYGDDYDPGGLSNAKTHRVVCLPGWVVQNRAVSGQLWALSKQTKTVMIEVCNLEKIAAS